MAIQNLLSACCLAVALFIPLYGDYNCAKTVPAWAQLQDIKDRELIIRVIGERWRSVVPFM